MLLLDEKLLIFFQNSYPLTPRFWIWGAGMANLLTPPGLKKSLLWTSIQMPRSFLEKMSHSSIKTVRNLGPPTLKTLTSFLRVIFSSTFRTRTLSVALLTKFTKHSTLVVALSPWGQMLGLWAVPIGIFGIIICLSQSVLSEKRS